MKKYGLYSLITGVLCTIFGFLMTFGLGDTSDNQPPHHPAIVWAAVAVLVLALLITSLWNWFAGSPDEPTTPTIESREP